MQTLSVMARELSVTDNAPPADTDRRHSHSGAPNAAEQDIKAAVGNSRPQHPKPPPAGMVGVDQRCPPHGIKAICGRRPRMEDAFSAIPFLLEVPVPQFASAQSEIYPARMGPDSAKSEQTGSADVGLGALAAATAAAAAENSTGQAAQESQESQAGQQAPYLETLHFFGVFDGHGGADAAVHCAQTLHQRIVEAVTTGSCAPDTGSADSAQGPAADPASPKQEGQAEATAPQAAAKADKGVAPTAREPMTASESDAIIQDSLAEHEALSDEHQVSWACCGSHEPAPVARLGPGAEHTACC